MKDFVKTMLAVICGIITLQIIKAILFALSIGSIIAAAGASGLSSSKGNTNLSGILDLNLSEIVLAEQVNQNDFLSGMSFSSGAVLQTVGLRDAVQSIRAAAEDPAIKFILLRPDGVNAGMADLESLRHALSDFRTSGKAVVAYTESPSNASYYLASVADKIYMSSAKSDSYQLIGLSGRMIFLKDVLDKLGVRYQLIRHGKYKSAGEMYIRNSASQENREQNLVMIKSAWKNLSREICGSREISENTFNSLIDNLSLLFPEDFLKAGLVDEIMDHEAILSKLATLSQVDDPSLLSFVSFPEYVTSKTALGNILSSHSNSVAVIYADGEIVDGKGYEGVSGDRFVAIVDKVRKDASVKAVVLRVNSPGGSVSASEKIRSSLALLAKDKPLVASFGNYAASGGYWISTPCSKIYSMPNTITGSIGVFSLIPEFSSAASKIGVKIETVGSNAHSDMFSLMRPFDKAETAYLQSAVEDIYDMFVNLVSTSRSIPYSDVDSIAQGRIWMGSDALGLGLVDEMGTLEDAIDCAAGLAGLTQSGYGVVSYPRPLDFATQLSMAFGGKDEDIPVILSGTPFEALGKEIAGMRNSQCEKVYARIPWVMEIK